MGYIRGWVWGVLILGLALMVQRSWGQTGVERADFPASAVSAGPDTSVGAALQSLGARAGVVFVGQCTKIERKGGVVEVSFAVSQPVRGEAGGVYVLREWSGLWQGGEQRYRVGQRAMVFLHAAGASGLASPVDGMEGVVPVVDAGTGAMLDVRLLETRVLRAQGAPLANETGGGISLQEGVAAVVGRRVLEPIRRPLPVGLRPAPVQAQVAMAGAGSLVRGDMYVAQ